MMLTDHLIDDGANDYSLLFDDIRVLDQLAFPEHDGPTPHPEVQGDCELLDDIRAADRILRAHETRLESVIPAGHRSERCYAELKILRNRSLKLETGSPMGNKNLVRGLPARHGLRRSIIYPARAPPFRWTEPKQMTQSSTSIDG